MAMKEFRKFISKSSKKTLLLATAVLLGIIVLTLILGSGMQMRGGVYTLPPSLPAPKPIPTPLPKEPSMFESKVAELEYVGRMVIYTAHLRLEVEDVDSAIDEVSRLAEGSGGFVASVSTSKSGARKFGVITIRVPQDKFYEVIWQIENLGEVESKEVRGEDVTEKYIDLKARLSNLQKEEKRLLEILDMCTKVEEVLKVESELSRVRGEIERLTGQMQYIERRVELATITVSLTEIVPEPWVEVPEVDWGASIEAGLKSLCILIQALITSSIIAAPFIVAGAMVYHIYHRKKSSKSPSS